MVDLNFVVRMIPFCLFSSLQKLEISMYNIGGATLLLALDLNISKIN